MSDPAPGWYPENETTLRYWDGTQWTEHTHPVAGQQSETQDVAVVDDVQVATVDVASGQASVAEDADVTAVTVDPAAQAPSQAGLYPDNGQTYAQQQAFPSNGQQYPDNGQQYAAAPAYAQPQAYPDNGQPYVQAPAVVVPVVTNGVILQNQRPVANLQTDRSLAKFILLGLVTLGFYGIWMIARSAEDLDTIAGRYDGQRSMNYWLLTFLIGPITLQIATIFWWIKVSDRVGNEQQRRGLPKTLSSTDYWLWGVLGSLIIVGPFIFLHKFFEAMNQLSANYNVNG